MRTIILYESLHHGNTRKLVDAIAEQFPVELHDARSFTGDLSDYDAVGFASGIDQVVLGGKEALSVRSFRVDEMNWMAQAETDAPVDCSVKIRSTGAPRGPATFQGGVCTVPDGIVGVAPGQSAVFYDADGVILCGGVIR